MSVLVILTLATVAPALSLHQGLEGLKLVHLLYRHGDRTPISPYPTDPYKDRKLWPVDFGQLTSRGKMAHFRLGQWLRQRYNGFLGSDYNDKEILVRSTDVDRTLMSAQSNLAGLFPPKGYLKWNPHLDWQPIPVHTMPLKYDSLLSSHADCPRFEQLQEELKQSQWMMNLYNDNKDLFQYISNNTGWNITDIRKLDYVYDTLLCETVHNMSLPEWTGKVFPHGKFQELRDLSFIMDTYTHELKRLKGGPFIKELVSHLEDFVNGDLDPPERKLFMYSAHDTTISTVLNSLDVFDPVAPSYAALVMFEFFEENSQYFVQILYRNDSTRDPYVLTLKGCDSKCSFSKFKDLTSSIIPSNWDAECGKASSSSFVSPTVTLVAALASTVMASVILVAALASFCRCSRKESEPHRYQRVDQLEIDADSES